MGRGDKSIEQKKKGKLSPTLLVPLLIFILFIARKTETMYI